MKHLISLSFKYMKGQKLRSTLTFLCIMLAVFIMNTFSAYFSSIRATLTNSVIQNDGAWEINISDLLESCEDREKAADIIANHAVVSAHSAEEWLHLNAFAGRGEDGYLPYYSLQIGDGEPIALTEISARNISSGSVSGDYWDFEEIAIPKDAAIVPVWLHDLGYEIGDTVTLTITPTMAQIDENDAKTKALRQMLADKYVEGEYLAYVSDDPIELQPDKETQRNTSTCIYNSLFSWFCDSGYGVSEIPFVNQQYGTPCTVTFRIHDFFYVNYEKNYFCINTCFGSDIDLSALHTQNPDFLDGMNGYAETTCYAAIRIHDHVDFEEAQKTLLLDLGMSELDFYTFFPPTSEAIFHQELLCYEGKSAQAIAFMLPVIALALLLALLVWSISRFVIDNAFEISIKERVSQFAVLRIMGASRGQLLALVFTEAIFYCLTAVPIGILAAFGLCKLVFDSFHENGFAFFEFHADPLVTFIGIFLCVAAICISAYTSAMWAARKLSPLEALNYGMKKQKKRRLKLRRSKLNLRAPEFITTYTMRNIGTCKSRFVISSIAMTLGVVMFIFCTLTFLISGKLLRAEQNIFGNCDFAIELEGNEGGDILPLADEYFLDNQDLAEYIVNRAVYFSLQETPTQLNEYLPDAYYNFPYTAISLVSRSEFDRYLAETAGFGYDEWLAQKSCMLYYSPYGGYMIEMDELNADGSRPRKYEDSFKTIPAAQLLPETGDPIPVNTVICTDHPSWSFDVSTLLLPYELHKEMLPSDQQMYSQIYLTVKNAKAYDSMLPQIEAFQDAYTKEFLHVAWYIDNFAACTGQKEMIDNVITVVVIFLISVWSVGVLTMVNSINTSVLNRKRELTMLRSVGMTKKQLVGSVFLESLLYSAISTCTGLLLGVIAFFYMTDELSGMFPATMVRTILPTMIGVLLLTLVINLLLALLAAIPGIRTVKTIS